MTNLTSPLAFVSGEVVLSINGPLAFTQRLEPILERFTTGLRGLFVMGKKFYVELPDSVRLFRIDVRMYFLLMAIHFGLGGAAFMTDFAGRPAFVLVEFRVRLLEVVTEHVGE